MSQHDSVGSPVGLRGGAYREPALRGVIPVAVAIVEHCAVRDAHPAIVIGKLVGMGEDGIGLASLGHIRTIDAQVRSFDVGRTHHTRVVGHVEGIVSQEEVIVAIVVDDFGSLGTLPTRGGIAREDALAIGSLVGTTPRIGQRVGNWFSCIGIEFHDCKATVP